MTKESKAAISAAEMSLDGEYCANYILVDGSPVPEPDVVKWAEWFEGSHKERVVARDEVDGFIVSTVFLAVNHNWGGGLPLIYETVVTDSYGGEGSATRYSTPEAARVGHDVEVAALKRVDLVEVRKELLEP